MKQVTKSRNKYIDIINNLQERIESLEIEVDFWRERFYEREGQN